MIEIWELDNLEAIEEVSPITFRKGVFHLGCYKLLIEEAKQMPSSEIDYSNRYDEYLHKDIALINV